jgi:hypothetical protein
MTVIGTLALGLNFITHHHVESGDRSINNCYGRIGDSLRSPPLKGGGRPRRYQFVWDGAKVAVPPADKPDRRHMRRIIRSFRTEDNQRTPALSNHPPPERARVA